MGKRPRFPSRRLVVEYYKIAASQRLAGRSTVASVPVVLLPELRGAWSRPQRTCDMASVIAGISGFLGKTLASNDVRIFDLRRSYGRQTLDFDAH